VDDFLNRLTTVTKRDAQAAVFEKFVLNKKLTGDEMKYLTRRICGDLKIYAGEKILMEALHPDAYKQWTLTHDIKSVVDRVTGNSSMTQSLNASLDIDIDALIASGSDEEAEKVYPTK
jgi:hypothetical protein